jgi:hypothetical protein
MRVPDVRAHMPEPQRDGKTSGARRHPSSSLARGGIEKAGRLPDLSGLRVAATAHLLPKAGNWRNFALTLSLLRLLCG